MKFLNFQNRFFIPAILFLLNFILKILYLDSNDIALDEPFSIFHSQQSISEIFEMLKSENNPPLHFLLLHYWIKLFGIEAFSVRFPSLIFSACTSVVIYFMAHKFWNLRVAITSSLIFSLSSFHIYFAHEARVYALFALLASLSVYFYLMLIEKPQSPRYFITLLVVNAAMIYSHYIGLVTVLTEFIFCFFTGKEKKTILKKMVLNNFILVLIFSPVLIIFLERLQIYSSQGTWVSKPGISELYETIRKFSNAPAVAVFFLTLSGASAIRFFVKRESTGIPVKFLTVYFLFSLVGLFFISQISSVFLDRYLIFISVPFYILTGVAAEHLFQSNFLRIASMTVVLAAMIFTVKLNPVNHRKMKEYVEFIRSKKENNTKIIITPYWGDVAIMYYYNREIFSDYKNFYSKLERENIFPSNDIKYIEQITQPENLTVIFADMENRLFNKENKIYMLLKKKYNREEGKRFGTMGVVKLYH